MKIENEMSEKMKADEEEDNDEQSQPLSYKWK
jgi:hypothetical protein